jgi:hypothetical protein
MAPDDQQLIGTAYHEAGHSLVALVFDMPIAFATIAPKGEFLGYMQYYPAVRFTDEATARNELQVNLAGPLAEAIHEFGPENLEVDQGPWLSPSKDFVNARRNAAVVCRATGHSRRQVLVQSAHDAHRLLVERWPAVEAIADALLSRPTEKLYAAELRQAVDNADLFGPLCRSA